MPKSDSDLSLQAQDLMMFISHVAAGLVGSTYIISAVHLHPAAFMCTAKYIEPVSLTRLVFQVLS